MIVYQRTIGQFCFFFLAAPTANSHLTFQTAFNCKFAAQLQIRSLPWKRRPTKNSQLTLGNGIQLQIRSLLSETASNCKFAAYLRKRHPTANSQLTFGNKHVCLMVSPEDKFFSIREKDLSRLTSDRKRAHVEQSHVEIVVFLNNDTSDEDIEGCKILDFVAPDLMCYNRNPHFDFRAPNESIFKQIDALLKPDCFFQIHAIYAGDDIDSFK